MRTFYYFFDFTYAFLFVFTFSFRGTLGRRSVVERESVSVEEEFDTGAGGGEKRETHGAISRKAVVFAGGCLFRR